MATAYKKSYIGLGSNLDNPLRQVTMASGLIGELENTQLVQCSPWVESYAIGPGKQPNFINGVVEVLTALTPHDLLAQLQKIEHSANRQRIIKWGPRTLDLDILLYANEIINSATICIPHPHLTERDFVVIPLLAIAPQLQLPDGQALQSVAQQLSIKAGRTQTCWLVDANN